MKFEPVYGSAFKLTLSEEKVLGLLAKGLHPKEIAGRLGKKVKTVLVNIENILMKLNVHSRDEAVEEARRQKLVVAS